MPWHGLVRQAATCRDHDHYLHSTLRQSDTPYLEGRGAEYVNDELLPYLHGFKLRAVGPDTIEYKIGEIFASSSRPGRAAIISASTRASLQL